MEEAIGRRQRIMRLLLIISLYVAGLALAFFVGVYWGRWNDPVPDTVRLKTPLVVLSPGEGQLEGTLPSGTVLYRIKDDPFAQNMVMYRAYVNFIIDDSLEGRHGEFAANQCLRGSLRVLGVASLKWR